VTAKDHSHEWRTAPENSELRMRAVQEHGNRHAGCDCHPEELSDMPIYVCECGLMVAWPDTPDFAEGQQAADF
jgi:hypothetical protein